MAQRHESPKDDPVEELTKLAEITTDCERLFEGVLTDLKNGKILSLATQALLQQHLGGSRGSSVIKMVEDRLAKIKKREVAVLIGGEFNAGKSTFVNILMGGKYLPMARKKVTRVVCEIRHSDLRRAYLKFDDEETDVELEIAIESNDNTWGVLRECIRKKTYVDNGKTRTIKRIIIYWPLKVLEELQALDSMQDRTDGQRWTLQPDALERLRRPYARSFRNENQTETQLDPDETIRKEVVPTNNQAKVIYERSNPTENTDTHIPRSKPIGIAQNEAVGTTTQVLGSSIENASDFAPGSQQSREFNLHGGQQQQQQQPQTDISIEREETSSPQMQTLKETSRHNEASNSVDYDETDPKRVPESAEPETTAQAGNELAPFNFVVLDCPGVDPDPDDSKDTILTTEYHDIVVETNRCQAFIFVIDTSKDEGVNKHGIKLLMKGIEMSHKEHSVEINPDKSLFIANKSEKLMDDEKELDDLRKDVTAKLTQTWPLIRKERVFPFQADRVLEDYERRSIEIKQLIQNFILRAMRLTIEENCIWLLRMLENAHVIAKRGKQNFPLVQKLSEKLREVRKDAVDVIEDAQIISADDVYQNAWRNLKDVLKRHEDAIRKINWTNDEIETMIPKTEEDWDVIQSNAHKLIGNKVKNFFPAKADELKQAYLKELNKIYKNVDDKIERMEALVRGLDGIQLFEGGWGKGLFSLFAPAALSASVRAAPVMYPFAFLVALVLPVGLFGQLVYEDIRDSINDSRKQHFKKNKIKFMVDETEKVLNIALKEIKNKRSIPESPLFTYFFGESRKEVLVGQMKRLLNTLDILEDTTFESSELNKHTSKQHLMEMMKFYVVKVMKHEYIEPDYIIWARNAEGHIRMIERGSNANTYEASLPGTPRTKPIAVKEFQCKIESSDSSNSLPRDFDAFRECYYLRLLSSKGHDKLVKFLGTGFSKSDGILYLRIVMERYLGNLQLVIKSKRHSTVDKREEFLHYAKECTEGLKFLHDNNVLHRDVKPSNFLIKQNEGEESKGGERSGFYSVVITDVGCAKAEEAICTKGQTLGTRVYWAPEILKDNTFHSKSSDMFSLGLVLWEIWNRQFSYDKNGLRRNNLMSIVKREDIPGVGSCLVEDPRGRISAAGLLKILDDAQAQ